MKTIAIDCRFASTESGLGRYTREIVMHLLQLRGFHFLLLVRSKSEAWIPVESSEVMVVEADSDHYSFAEQILLPALLKQYPVDLFFSPHFNVPFLCPVPFVATIHDLILHRFPNDASFFKRRAYHHLMHHTVTHAKRLLTVSPFVKNEIASVFDASVAAKTTVVKEGVDGAFHPLSQVVIDAALARHNIRSPYFLYVGNAKQHKNVRMLLDAFAKSGRSDAELILICSGKECDQLLPLSSRVRIIGNISDADLPALYNGALALVTASLYEGFCLPVAEALACGTPVIATNASAIRDIASGHALLIDPTVDAFAAAFTKPPSKQPSFIVGTWQEAARETSATFQEILR